MNQRNNKCLRFISILLFVAMLISSQSFIVIAQEAIELTTSSELNTAKSVDSTAEEELVELADKIDEDVTTSTEDNTSNTEIEEVVDVNLPARQGDISEYEMSIIDMQVAGKTYSNLTADEKDLILEYLSSSAEKVEHLFAELEKQEIKLFGSVLVVRIVLDNVFTLDEAIKLYEMYPERWERDRVVHQFGSFGSHFNTENASNQVSAIAYEGDSLREQKANYVSAEAFTEAKQMLMSGYSVKEIRAAYYTAATFELDPADLLYKGREGTTEGETAFLGKYPINIEAVTSSVAMFNSGIEGTHEAVILADSDYEEIEAEILSTGVALYSTTEEEEEVGSVEELVKQPFDVSINERENINVNTGALKYTETIASIPEINGNGVTLNIIYDSDESNLADYYYTVTSRIRYRVYYTKTTYIDYYEEAVYTEGPTRSQTFSNLDDALEFMEEKDSYVEYITRPDDNYPSGYASGEIRYITDIEPYTSTTRNNRTKATTYNEKRYALGAGWSFNIPSIDMDANAIILPGKGVYNFSGNTIKDYDLCDMAISSYTNNSGPFESSKQLAFADGRKYYFNSNGLLLATQDKYGNTINYSYEKIDGEYRIARISDNYNHYITIEYVDSDGGKIITVTDAADNATVLHTKTLDSATYGSGNSVLEKIVYSDGESIEFDYKMEKGSFSFSSSSGSTLYFALLQTVKYVTGMHLNYEYAESSGKLGTSGSLSVFQIVQRYMTTSEEEGNVFGNITYEYSGSYTRCSTASSDYTYTTKIIQHIGNSKKITEYIFNKDHLCICQNKYVGEKLKQTIESIYGDLKLPEKVVTTYFGDGKDTIVSTEIYEYDDFGNIVLYISPKAEGDESNTEYLTSYEYNIELASNAYIGYNMPLSVTYKQDEDKTVFVKYELVNGDKSIGKKTVFVNDVEVEKNLYTYDNTTGRLLTETFYTDLNLDSVVVTEYIYNDNEESESYGMLSSVVIKDVIDNDSVLKQLLTIYTYDKMGRMLTVETAEADSNGEIIEAKSKSTYTYDDRGRTTKVINPDNGYTEYIYDTVNNTTTVINSVLDTITYDYDSIGHIETTRYADGTVATERFYDENGRIIAEAMSRDSSSATTTYYAYDAFDRVTEKATYDVNNTLVYRETYEYNDVYTSILALVTKTIHGDENAADIVTKTYTNKNGEIVKEDVGGVVTEYEYDYVGNTTRIFYDETTIANYTYDHVGNVTSETNALGDTRTVTYDAIGRKIAESDYRGNITNYTYDSAGRLLVMTAPFADGVNTTIKYYYDANGNITKQQQTAQAESSAETVWRTVEYEYDCMNRVTDIINHVDDVTKQYTHYSYDEVGNLTDVYTGLTQPWSVDLSPNMYSHIEYTYDGRGNNTSLADAHEQSETYQYDVLGTLTTSTLRDGTVYDYTYNPFGTVADIVTLNGEVVSESNTTYTSTGAVRSVTLDGVTVSYTYDGLGNVLTETEGNVVKTYTYDNRGRKSGYTLTIDGEQISSATYSYDSLNRLTSVTEGGITTTYEYDENGNRSEQIVDNVVTTYSYNDANLVIELTNKLNGTVISQFAYTYYTDGNMRTKAETLEANATSNTTYVYDGIGRLTSEETDGVAITYEYDANNNRVKMTNAGVVTTYTYDANNRLLTETIDGIPTTYTYDENGNLLAILTHYSDTHTFVGGVCAVCGAPATYMLGDMNGDGEISLIDVLRITKLNAGQTQSATYGLETAQTFDSEDLDQNGVVDVEDYWLFLEFTIGYNRVSTMSVSEDEADIAFADVDGNGTVDTADYTIALAEYNEPSDKMARLAADVNGDGEITYDDVDLTVHHVLDGCVCAVGSIANNTSTCTSEKVYTYNARGQQTGYTASASGGFSHSFEEGVCTACGEAESFMLGDADGNGIINFLDFLISMRYYVDMPDELPPQDLDGDGVAGRKDYLIFAREFAGVGEDYLPDLFAIDDLLAFADVDGNGEVGATDYLIAYATYYEKEISECLTNGISLQTSMKAADINGDGEITEADKDIGIDYALNGNDTYPIGEIVENTVPCRAAINSKAVDAHYCYYSNGLRSAKTVDGDTKYFIYNGSQIVFEYKGSVGEGTVYYYGLNRTHNSNGEIYVYNAHGDTVQLVKNNVVAVIYTYDAFGNLTFQAGESDNPFKYSSEYFDEETQTYYLRARYYNPANGRFTKQDVWAFMDIADPMSLNLYTYCGNNPVMYVDPSGNLREPGYVNGKWYENPDLAEFGERSDTYKILVDLSERWWDADDDERERLHNLAEKTREMFRRGTPYKYGNSLIKELLHANAEEALDYIDIYRSCIQDGYAWVNPHTWLTLKHFECFGGPWDYKWDPNWQVPSHYEDSFFTMDNGEIDYYKDRRNYFSWIYFEGELMGADKLANLNWGYVGAKMGYDGWLLLNIFTDHKNEGEGGDGYWIRKGMSMANEGY